jgi:PPOX class probable F420-dependent enzyme
MPFGPEGESRRTTPCGSLLASTSSSARKTRQKYRNIGRDPRIPLSIVDPENPYRYLEVRGEVVRVEEDPDLDFINAMSKKYLGQDKYPFHPPGDERVVIYVEPRHTTQMGS